MMSEQCPSINEKAMDDFEEFLNSLDGLSVEDAEMRILRFYPDLQLSIDEDEDPVELKEHQVWCCDSGKGEITPIPVYRHFYMHVDKGNLVTADINKVWVSPNTYGENPYRHYGCVVWDDSIEDIIPETQLYGD
ncbi:hypothetical protein [Salmonella phage SSBI34]|nr:hypothetical protein [Salmonella phage SSBI34]